MKKVSIYPILYFTFLLFANDMFSQEYLRMMESDKYSVYEIGESAEKYFFDKYKGRGSGYNQFKRWEYNALRMMDENGYLKPDELYTREWEKMNSEINDSSGVYLRTSDFWTEHGPNYYSATTGWNPGVGRITTFVIHPDDENIIIVGAESGGIWKSINGGQSWVTLTDNFSNLAVESLVMSPVNQNILYFGSTLGRIYKSEDGGNSWVLSGTAGSSRVRRLLINPQNPDIMFACSQNAGFYRSDNQGKTWTKVSTDNYAYDIVFKPGDLNTVYASGYYFQKSQDGGKTFKQYNAGTTKYYLLNIISPGSLKKGYDAVDNAFGQGHVQIPFSPDSIGGKLVLYKDQSGNSSLGCGDAANTTELYGNIAVIRRGDCYFVDKVLNAQKAGAKAVIIVNKTPGESPFAMSGSNAEIQIPAIMISYEDGEFLIEQMKTIEISAKFQIDKSAFNAMKISPKAIAVSPDNPEVIYLLEAEGGKFSGLFKSVNSGESFVKLDHPRNYLGYSTSGNDDAGQAPRNMEIAVNPNNADEVHIGGILTWHSFDGGVSFSCSSDWVPNNAKGANIGYCHADINRLMFYNNKLYAGTDGGIFKSENTSNLSKDYYKDLTTGLGIRHFYKIGVSQSDPVVVSGGSQDNGTSWYSPVTGWKDWLGADGMETFIDKNDPEVMYGTIQYGGMYRKEKAGGTNGIDAPDEREGNWVTPFEQDPVLQNTIYVGYEAVYKSTNRGNTWTQISQEFTYKLNHLKIAPSNNNIMYAAAQGELYKTKTGGGTWERIYGFSGSVTSIAIHPKDPDKVALATSSVNKVFVSYDGGKTWKIFLKNLPNFNALAIVWQDDNVEGLYVGMNYGIFYINNTMNNWIPYSSNLPNVIINELEINYKENRIYAATYGRGLWSSPIVEWNPDYTYEPAEPVILFSPNPVKDILTVASPDNAFEIGLIEIFNQNGKRIKKLFSGNNTILTVNISDFKEGIYYIRITGDNGRITKKIEKIK
ncbi:MAG: VPS10 domain-containing protein [Deltaproteobacteria bacterium]